MVQVATTLPKFKYYKAEPTFPQKKFEGILPAIANETDGVTCNNSFIALPWGAMSTVAVFPAQKFTRFEKSLNLIKGHKGNITDCQFSHFNQNLLATASEDGIIKLWLIPDEGIAGHVTESDGDLLGHNKKVTGIAWHRTADNLMASHGADSTVRIWDIVNQKNSITWSDDINNEGITGMRWSPQGDKIGVTKKRGGLMIFDPRNLEVITRGEACIGAKAQKLAWIDNDNFIVSGFNKSAEREFKIFDCRNLSEPLSQGPLGNGLGVGHMYYDEQHNLLHVAGRGEMNISMFEVNKSSQTPVKLLTDWVGATPQKGFMMMEKPCIDVNKHEVNRGVRLSNNGIIEFLSFTLVNRTGAFQPELFPPFHSNEASMNCEEWLAGANKAPITMQLEEKVTEQCQTKKNAFANKLGGKATTVAAVDNSAEILALKTEVDSLKAKLEEAKSAQPVAQPVAEIVAQPVAQEELNLDSHPTFGYWDARAAGAPVRYMLHYCGVQFEEVMYGPSSRAKKDANGWFADDKLNLGLDLPNLPYLIDGDFKLTEMDAIMHYIASKWNPSLLGCSTVERARVIMVASFIRELRDKSYKPAYGKDQDMEVFTPAMEPFNKLMDYLKNNNFEWLSGNQVTYVDFYFFEISSWLLSILPEKFGSPELTAYHERVTALPAFAQVWADDEKCIKTPFQASFAWIGDQ